MEVSKFFLSTKEFSTPQVPVCQCLNSHCYNRSQCVLIATVITDLSVSYLLIVPTEIGADGGNTLLYFIKDLPLFLGAPGVLP